MLSQRNPTYRFQDHGLLSDHTIKDIQNESHLVNSTMPPDNRFDLSPPARTVQVGEQHSLPQAFGSSVHQGHDHATYPIEDNVAHAGVFLQRPCTRCQHLSLSVCIAQCKEKRPSFQKQMLVPGLNDMQVVQVQQMRK